MKRKKRNGATLVPVSFSHPRGEGTPRAAFMEDELGEQLMVARSEEFPDRVLIGAVDSQAPCVLDRVRASVLALMLARFSRTGEIRPPTTVASVARMTRDQAHKAGVVYVGRPFPRRGFDGHPLANPFRIGKGASEDERLECVTQYVEWLYADPERVTLARSLRGKCLGCWCGTWWGIGDPGFVCHAVAIAKVAETLDGDPLPVPA